MKKKIFLTGMFLSSLILMSSVSKAQTKDQFVTLTLSVSKKDNQYKIARVKSKLVNGIYKKSFSPITEVNEGDMVGIILNEKNVPVDTVLIKDPLSIRYEYPQDNGVIGSVVMPQQENEIVVRFNYARHMKSLLINKYGKDKRMATITTLELFQK